MTRTPLYCLVPLEDGFQVKMTLPLGLTPDEAHRLKTMLDENTRDPSDAEKWAVSDPHIYPEITL